MNEQGKTLVTVKEGHRWVTRWVEEPVKAIETKETYNGWSNRETWLVNLWMTNDVGDDDYLRALANDGRPIYERSDELKETLTDAWNEISNGSGFGWGLWIDLMNDALGTVDWREIIQNHEEDEND